MSNSIRVTCEGAAYLPVESLIHFQGNLKSLSNSDYTRMKGMILDLGFSEPVSVWRNGDKVYILNGHQRCRVVRRMISDEGYSCPALPVSFVEAADANEAKRKVLSLTSQYGKMEKDGLYEFLEGSDIQAEELMESFRFPEIDIAAFTEEYYVDTEAEDVLDVGGMDTDESNAAGSAGPVPLVPLPSALGDLTQAGGNTAHVKMVQLFFAAEVHKEFIALCTALGHAYKTDNITDTVARAVRSAHEKDAANS
jgi:hypothetical protein